MNNLCIKCNKKEITRRGNMCEICFENHSMDYDKLSKALSNDYYWSIEQWVVDKDVVPNNKFLLNIWKADNGNGIKVYCYKDKSKNKSWDGEWLYDIKEILEYIGVEKEE